MRSPWEVSRGSATINAERLDVVTLSKARKQLGVYVAAAKRDLAAVALPQLVDQLTSLYEDVAAERVTTDDLRTLLRDAWSGLPAARILGRQLTADQFSQALALDVGDNKMNTHSIKGFGGARDAAINRAAGLLGRKETTGRKLLKMAPVTFPFDVDKIAACRLRYVLTLLFPDADSRRLAKVVSIAAHELREPTAPEVPSSWWLPWPRPQSSGADGALSPSAKRAAVVANLFRILGGDDDVALEWARRRYLFTDPAQSRGDDSVTTDPDWAAFDPWFNVTKP